MSLLLMLVLAASACSSGVMASEVLGLDSKETTTSSLGADESAEEDASEESTDEAVPDEEIDDSESDDESRDEDRDDQDDGAPQSPPGTINELEDLIGNEGDAGLPSRADDSTLERLVSLLLEDDGLEVSEAEARCAGRMLEEGLSATSFELLVANVETNDEIEVGNQFTDAEWVVISESLANCLDYRELIDEVVADAPALDDLVSCLAAEITVDGVEALLLFEVLSERRDGSATPLFSTGLELCPTEARVAIDAEILDEFLLADGPAVEACLAEISNDQIRPFFETRDFAELIMLVRENCLF